MNKKSKPCRLPFFRVVSFVLASAVLALSLIGCSSMEEYADWLPNGGGQAVTSSAESRTQGKSAYTSSETPPSKISSEPTSVSSDTSSISSDLTEEDERLRILKQSHSHYGYYELSKKLQKCYEDIENAIFLMKKEFTTPQVTAEELAKVIEYFLQDNPLVYWLGSKYSYRQKLDGKIEIYFTYINDYDSVGTTIRAIEAAGTAIIGSISKELSDFDRITLVHDTLVRMVEYDLTAPRPSDTAGALLDKRATCLGYAKAYQYLLSRMGIMALVAYGYAGEGHAWNIVWLEENYYHVDATWDDRKSAGGDHVSHAYMLLSDKAISITHTVQKDKSYTLPPCKSEESYMLRKGVVVSSDDEAALNAAFEKALDIAAADNNAVIEIGFSTSELGKKISKSLSDGSVDEIIRSVCEARSIAPPIGRYINDANTVLTYLRW